MSDEKKEKCAQEGKTCASCSEKGTCGHGQDKPAFDPPNPLSKIKHVVAIMSGKGGVGKSTVTALLAVALTRDGNQVGILDADVTGPSIPKLFGLKSKPDASELGIFAPRTNTLGIRAMSMNLFLEREDEPVIWRGPIISNVIRQFWTEVIWGDLDYLLVDLPPGTGDAPLTVMQSLPLDGVIIVSSPQELAVMVVKKAIHMAEIVNIPILGLIENMAYAICPHCGQKFYPFGEPKGERVASEVGIPFLGHLPINPELARLGDEGKIEEVEHTGLGEAPKLLAEQLARHSRTAHLLFGGQKPQ
ncbi:Mrp/NBP35 family ATP-binding protein [Desulfothermobacter acidiphilus]|uniref:Mrp/NBP35 family ATP-binding protein n=1 Tax=Desulfothermobacter acidiphilus TaxID=1938353 RepID=UPI003F8AD001